MLSAGTGEGAEGTQQQLVPVPWSAQRVPSKPLCMSSFLCQRVRSAYDEVKWDWQEYRERVERFFQMMQKPGTWRGRREVTAFLSLSATAYVCTSAFSGTFLD
jgi:hypothetical protein